MVVVTVPEGTFLTSGVVVNSGVYIASGIVVTILPSVSLIINNSGNPLLLTSDSGGNMLWSGAIKSAIVTAPASNSGDIYIGGYTNGQMPYSGVGLPVSPGRTVEINVVNLGHIHVFGTTSGYDSVGYLGMG